MMYRIERVDFPQVRRKEYMGRKILPCKGSVTRTKLVTAISVYNQLCNDFASHLRNCSENPELNSVNLR